MRQETIKQEATMTEGLLKKTMQTGAQVAQAGLEASRLKATVEHAVEDGVTAAKRLAKRGRYAAEDLVDEAAYCVKREPLRSVAITLGIGFGLGALVGWFASRQSKA